MRRFSVFFAVFILLLCSISFAENRKSIEEKLKNISYTIQKKKEYYEKVRKQYVNVLSQISLTDRKISILKKRIEMAKRDLSLLNRKIAMARNEIERVSTDLDTKKKRLYKELVSYYEYSRLSKYSSKGVWYSYMNRFVTSYMQDKIKSYISKREYLKDRINKLNLYLAKKKNLLDRIKKQQDSLGTQKAKLKKLAELAENRKKQYLKEIAYLTKQRKNLKNLLKHIIQQERIEKMKRKERYITKYRINPKLVEREFKVLAHKIMPPVRGRIVGYFGRKYDPVFKVYTRNDGIDIEAKKGSCVRTIAYGRVAYVGNLLGYGGVVIINHLNGYYTVYGGVRSWLKVGDIVKTYQCIGRMTSNKLHFEIRRHAIPVNPLDFLNRRFLK